MKSLKLMAFALGLLGWCYSGTYANTLTYKFVFSQSNYTVLDGSTVTVGVALQETGSTGDPFVLAPAGVGLTGTGVTVTYPSGGVATVASVTDITGNPSFDNAGFGIASTLSPGSAGFTESIFFNPAVTGTLVSPNTYQLNLGFFTFTAGSTPGAESITASIFDPSLVSIVTGNGTGLDLVTTSGSAMLTVGFPEPVLLPLPNAMWIGLTALPLAMIGRRRNLDRQSAN